MMDPRAHATGGRRSGLRTRIGIYVPALVVFTIAVTAWVALVLVGAAVEEQFEDELAGLVRGLERRVEARGEAARELVEELVGRLLRSDPSRIEAMLDPRRRTERRVVGSAAQMLELSGLDTLLILDREGRILSSGHWPEQAGQYAARALRLPENVPSWMRSADASGEHLAQVVRREVRFGDRGIILVGGMFLDAAGLEAVAIAGESLVVEDATGRRVDARRGSSGAAAPTGRGAGWAERVLEIDGPDEERVGRLRVAVSREPLSRLRSRLRWTFLFVGLLGAAVGGVGGAILARVATRPVEEAIRAVEAVAAGEADYSFPGTSGDELGSVPERFSRLQRSLADHQRRRAAAERAAAWREVARQVAHEVKNPLAPIRLSVENLIKARRRSPEIFEEIFEDGCRAILEEVEQLRRIVSDFSEFARLPEPRPRAVDLDRLIDSVVALYAGEPGLVVERRRGPGLASIQADPDLLSRALKNVVANAVEAMGEGGGTLTVETGSDGQMAHVRVLDTGPGFSPAAADRLFEPYFTTRPEGTGLGMTIAYRIVAEHGGFITASNRAEGGAEVVVKLAAGAAARAGHRSREVLA